MDDLNDRHDLDEQPAPLDQDPELWDWARTAGVSREELRAAVERSQPGVN
jgi:hypothetical protein